MDSVIRNECSHSLGFPIRKSPDHSLLAASRGLSQLTTSFFAYLRLGIHTHALSSLTIKSTSHTGNALRHSHDTPGPFLPFPKRSLTVAARIRLFGPSERYFSLFVYLC